RGGRGAQYLPPAARLPAARRPSRGAEAVLRLALLPGRRPLPDEPARAGRHPRAERPARPPGRHSFAATVRGRAVPATARALLAAVVQYPWSTAAVSARI